MRGEAIPSVSKVPGPGYRLLYKDCVRKNLFGLQIFGLMPLSLLSLLLFPGAAFQDGIVNFDLSRHSLISFENSPIKGIPP